MEDEALDRGSTGGPGGNDRALPADRLELVEHGHQGVRGPGTAPAGGWAVQGVESRTELRTP